MLDVVTYEKRIIGSAYGSLSPLVLVPRILELYRQGRLSSTSSSLIGCRSRGSTRASICRGERRACVRCWPSAVAAGFRRVPARLRFPYPRRRRHDEPTATQLGIDPEAIEAALDRNLTFPARWYSDPAIFDVELEHVFARSWQLVAHEARIAQPGDHHVCQVAHVPVVLTRGPRRRAARIRQRLPPPCLSRSRPRTATARRSSAQYHGWTYELDGCLRTCAALRARAGLRRGPSSRSCRSPSRPSDGFVFVNPDPARRRLREAYPELAELWTTRHLDFSSYRYVGRSEYEIPANWKVWVENATECYHCPTVHKSSFSDAWEVDVDVYEYVNVGGLLAQFTPYNPRAKTYRPLRRERRRRSGRQRLPLRLHVARVVLRGRRLRRVPRASSSRRARRAAASIADFFVNPACDDDVRRRVDRDVQPHARRGLRRPCSCSSPGCDPGWFRTAGSCRPARARSRISTGSSGSRSRKQAARKRRAQRLRPLGRQAAKLHRARQGSVQRSGLRGLVA